MRVLYWTGLFPPYIGGQETFSLELLHGLQQRGHEVTVISMKTGVALPEFDLFQGIPVYRFEFSLVLASRNLAQIRVLLERIGDLKNRFAPDLVHVNDDGVTVFFHLNTFHLYSCPTVTTVHAPVRVGAPNGSLSVRMLRASSRVVAVSQAIFKATTAFAPEIAPRASVLLNGLTMPLLEPAPLPYNPPRFLIMGRLVPEKGFDLALEAFAALLPHFPAVRLTVAGDGSARTYLEALAQHLGIGHATDFMGWTAPDEIPTLINAVTAVVVPSRWEEPFGLVALEGAQMARPVIATRVGGLPEIVVDGETGMVVTAADSAALASAMRSVLESPGASARMGAAARQRAARYFSGARMVDEYESLFSNVIREAKR